MDIGRMGQDGDQADSGVGAAPEAKDTPLSAPDDETFDARLQEFRPIIERILGQNGGIALDTLLDAVATIEGVEASDHESWFSGFVSCLDYVRISPEIVMGLSLWWREEVMTTLAKKGIDHRTADRQTQIGATILGETLRHRQEQRSEAHDADRR